MDGTKTQMVLKKMTLENNNFFHYFNIMINIMQYLNQKINHQRFNFKYLKIYQIKIIIIYIYDNTFIYSIENSKYAKINI